MVKKEDLSMIFDPAGFVETAELYADTVVTGYGTVDGRLCYVFLMNGEKGGIFSKEAGKKITNLYRLALKSKAPVIGVLDSCGFLIDDGAEALSAFSEVYATVSEASDKILQIMISGGLAKGQLASMAEMADFYYKDLSMEESLKRTKEILNILPHSKDMLPEQLSCDDDLNREIPGIEKSISNGREILVSISDNGYMIELDEAGSPELTAAIIKINGLPVAALANNSINGSDRMGLKSLIKAIRLVRLADRFNMSIVNVSNTDGMRTDEDEELMLIAMGKLAESFIKARVPKVNLITGKVTGGIYSVMNGRGAAADLTLMWEDSMVNIIDPKQAAEILYDPDPAEIDKMTEEYVRTHSAAERLEALGLCDKVIEPKMTRRYLAGALETYANVF